MKSYTLNKVITKPKKIACKNKSILMAIFLALKLNNSKRLIAYKLSLQLFFEGYFVDITFRNSGIINLSKVDIFLE